VTKHIQPSSDDVSFDAVVQVVRQWLMSLISAIGTTSYFDAWFAAVHLRVALERAERLVGIMSDESRVFTAGRLNDIRSIVTPIMALAPAPSRHEVRKMRSSDAQDRLTREHQDRWTREHMERQWGRSVQRQMKAVILKDDDNGDAGEPGRSHDGNASRKAIQHGARASSSEN
jgi:hypothetical protein